jgi:hypothetical protein
MPAKVAATVVPANVCPQAIGVALQTRSFTGAEGGGAAVCTLILKGVQLGAGHVSTMM